MPMYEYRCEDCSAGFERYSPTSCEGEKKIVCPECGSDEVVKVLSWFGSFANGKASSSCGPLRRYS